MGEMDRAVSTIERTVRVWPVESGEPRVLEGHQQNVNGVAFTPDGKSVVSVSYDPQLRIWPLAGGSTIIVTLPAPLNSVAVASDGSSDSRSRGRTAAAAS